MMPRTAAPHLHSAPSMRIVRVRDDTFNREDFPVTDAEFAETVLKAMRDSTGPTGVLDIREIAAQNGVTEKYQAQRVAERLRLEGMIASEGFTPDSLLAHITDRGLQALQSGDFGQVVDPGTALETGVGRQGAAEDA